MADRTEYRYDLFLSFAEDDRDWVEGYLLPALGLSKERVVTAQITSRSEAFQPGAIVVNEFQRAVTSSRYTLLVLSRTYLADPWSVFGEQLASYVAVAEQRERMIPLLRESDCRLPVHIEFRVGLDCTEQGKWEAEIGRLRQLLAQLEPKQEPIPCPYPGMVPFQEKDARFFHGREAEIQQMLLHFRHQRMLFVIGPSGCGKSSLVFAGLLPQLQRSAYFDEGFLLVKQMRPGPDPLQQLCRILGGDPNSELVAKLLRTNPPAQCLLLAVDQFEELFSQAEQAEQSGFIAALKGLRAAENCALLITMRADFYPELMNTDLWGEASGHRMEIVPLHGDALRVAIEKPAGDVGVYLERGLADRLVSDAAEEPGVLPLLQETMRLLWAGMVRRFLPLGAYQQLAVGSRSGLAVAITSKADATLDDLPGAEQKAIVRRIFLRLVQFGEGRPDTRRQQPVSSLRSERDDPQVFDQTLRHLEDNRLVTVTGEEGGQEKKVDLAHEALIAGWPRLREWLKQRRVAEQTRRRLENKADEWIRLQRKGGLLDEVEIREAEQWLQSPDAAELGGPSAELRALLQDSRYAIQEQKRLEDAARQRELEQAQALVAEKARKARIFKLLSGALGMVAAAAVILAVLAYVQSRTATSRQFAAEAGVEFSMRPGHAFALAVHAARLKRTYEVLDQLLSFVQSTSRVEHILFGPKELVEDVVFSSDGRYLASEHSIMSLIDKIMVWDVRSGKPLGPPLHLSNLTIPAYVTLGPEGTIVTVNPEGLLLRTWDPASGVMVHEEKIGLRLPGPIVALLAASTGRIAVIIGDGSVLWWDMKESGPIGGPLREHDTSLTTAAFSKDGKLFATEDGDGNVVIWDVEKGTPVSRPGFSQNEKGQEIWATGMAFSDDDKLLAWACKDATIAVWDIATKSLRQQLSTQQIHTAPIDGIAFRGNPEKLITLDGNGVMAEWSLESGPSNQATSVERLQFLEPNARHALNVDGIGAAGWGPEGNVVIWGKDIAASVLKRVSLAGQATSVRLSQDGERIAIYLKDGSINIQDAAESRPPFPIRPEGGGNQSFAWLTGERLAVGTKDGHFSLWDAASRQRLPDLPPAPTPVVPIAFSVDGKRFLSWGIKPEQRRLWKIGVDKMEEIPTTKRFKDMLSGLSIMSAAFSLDGNLLAVGTFQGATGIWDLRKDKWWAEPVNLSPNEGAFSTAFSPNGKWLASGHGGGYMLLWDVERGKQLGQGLKIFANGVSSLAFSTDGKRLIAVDEGQNLAIWDVDPESWMKRLCQLALPTLSKQEWKRIMRDQAYPPTCEEPQ